MRSATERSSTAATSERSSRPSASVPRTKRPGRSGTPSTTSTTRPPSCHSSSDDVDGRSMYCDPIRLSLTGG
jgi:hypothetical protein